MILRAATTFDADRLLAWRNDPATRSNSFTTDVVAGEAHAHWLGLILNDTRRELLVAEIKDEPVGTVRLDYYDAQCELSWTVAPNCRRRGFGRRMVALAIERANCTKLIAKIKIDNDASQHIARVLGFMVIAHEDGQAVWAYTKISDQERA